VRQVTVHSRWKDLANEIDLRAQNEHFDPSHGFGGSSWPPFCSKESEECVPHWSTTGEASWRQQDLVCLQQMHWQAEGAQH